MSSTSSALLLGLLLVAADACMRVTPGGPGMPAMNCKTCAANLIAITMAGNGAKPMTGDVTDATGTCAVRMFTCGPGMNSNIDINRGVGVVVDGDDGTVDMTAHFTVTCNAAGTAWQNAGVDITQLECAFD
ncbi:hypothetical protein PMAYCL1PPCAC_17140, partial [Pristionchus mayeri]